MGTLVTYIIDLIVSVAILHATYGIMRFVARCVLWLVCSFGEGARNVQGSGVPRAAKPQPSFVEITASARRA
jgi:hypothetical protein